MAEVDVKAYITEKVDNREYSLVCANSADLVEAYGAWHKIGQWILTKINENHAAQKPVEAPNEVPQEAPKEV